MIFNGSTKAKKLYIGSAKVKKVYKGTTKVWNSGYPISYYYGNTLLGVEDVEENADVLHPSITMPTRENYTFCGWTLENGSYNKVTELVATEPMNLYAMYLPNSINAVSNSRYISGSTYASASATPAYQGGQPLNSSASFVLNMHEYQNNSVTVVCQALYSGWVDNNQPSGNGKFDSSTISKNGSSTFTNISSGTHTVKTEGHTANEGEARNTQELRCYVSTLTLSNPVAWT